MKTLYPYGCADADLTLSLKFIFEAMLEAEDLIWLNKNLIIPLQHTLMLMELHGVPLDIDQAKAVLKSTADDMLTAENVVFQLCGTRFNVGPPAQLGRMLFEKMGLSGRKGLKGDWITDADTLENLNSPLSEPLLEFRRAQQIHGLYAEPALEKVVEVTNGGRVGWVHPEYWMDSVTGRLKLTEPNLTTLPRPENGGMIVKSMWCTDNDHRMIFKDFSQIELRVVAHVSGEPVWIDGFNAGQDMHAAMAHKINNLPCSVEEVKTLYSKERSDAKTINFGIIYGESEYSLAKRLDITEEEAHKLIHEDYFGAAPVLRQWVESTHNFVKNYGYVNTIFGRRRHLPDAMVPVPNGVSAPSWNERPKCYRRKAPRIG